MSIFLVAFWLGKDTRLWIMVMIIFSLLEMCTGFLVICEAYPVRCTLLPSRRSTRHQRAGPLPKEASSTHAISRPQMARPADPFFQLSCRDRE